MDKYNADDADRQHWSRIHLHNTFQHCCCHLPPYKPCGCDPEYFQILNLSFLMSSAFCRLRNSTTYVAFLVTEVGFTWQILLLSGYLYYLLCCILMWWLFIYRLVWIIYKLDFFFENLDHHLKVHIGSWCVIYI